MTGPPLAVRGASGAPGASSSGLGMVTGAGTQVGISRRGPRGRWLCPCEPLCTPVLAGTRRELPTLPAVTAWRGDLPQQGLPRTPPAPSASVPGGLGGWRPFSPSRCTPGNLAPERLCPSSCTGGGRQLNDRTRTGPRRSEEGASGLWVPRGEASSPLPRRCVSRCRDFLICP